MKAINFYVDGIGVLGPGLDHWASASDLLTGKSVYISKNTVLPSPDSLPPAERRRAGSIVKLTLAVGYEAAASAKRDVSLLPTVFSSSSSDGNAGHEICEILASTDRRISPTRFHTSVHNAASGYWSIATTSMAPSSVLCAYDASFGAGLLEAATQAIVGNTDVLLIAYDTTYPEPLRSVRCIPDQFGIGLVITPQKTAGSLSQMSLELTTDGADQLPDNALEGLRTSIPTARGLPMLAAIANRRTTSIVLDYLGNTGISLEITPCS
jgi:hypothetical protein